MRAVTCSTGGGRLTSLALPGGASHGALATDIHAVTAAAPPRWQAPLAGWPTYRSSAPQGSSSYLNFEVRRYSGTSHG